MMKARKGFTLIELLIVIVIIGILATISVVTYNGTVAKARRASTLAILNGTMQAASACIAGGGTIQTQQTWNQLYIYPTNATAGYKIENRNANICSDTKLTDAKWPAGDVNGYDLDAGTGGNWFNLVSDKKGNTLWTIFADFRNISPLPTDLTGSTLTGTFPSPTGTTNMGITCKITGCVATNP